MLFKDTHTDEIINKLCQLIFDISKSVLQNVIFSCCFKGILEYNKISC